MAIWGGKVQWGQNEYFNWKNVYILNSFYNKEEGNLKK